MRKLNLILLIAAVVLAGFFGCSNNEAESADATHKTAQEAQTVADETPSTGDPYYDSLATISHPVRNEANQIVTISTDFGDMVLELYHDVAPAHADSFVARTNDGFYNGLTFHRIIDNFMIQGGDPKGDGTGNSGYFLPAEFSDLPHKEGTLSMARGPNPNSASCQFFVCLARAKFLDNQYTVFGQLLKGYDSLHRIGKVKVVADARGKVEKPAEAVYIRKAFLSDADGKPIK